MKPSTSNQAVRSPLITTSPKKDVKGPSGTQSAPVGGATPKSFLGNWQVSGEKGVEKLIKIVFEYKN